MAIDPADRPLFAEVLAAAGLTPSGDRLAELFTTIPVVRERKGGDEPPLGATRVAGGPDLPRGTPWPRDASGLSYNFLLQVGLADLAVRDPRLPANGLLSIYSGTDVGTGPVLRIVEGESLVRHHLPQDAERVTAAAFDAITWSPAAGRFLADPQKVAREGLEIGTGPEGALTFMRGGEPVVVLADEYSVRPDTVPAETATWLALDPRAAVKMRADEALYTMVEKVEEELFRRSPRGLPTHRMLCEGRETTGPWSGRGLAASEAAKRGWDDIAEEDGWFTLIAVRSGGRAGFSFGDAGDYVVMLNEADARVGRFDRVYGYCESS